MPTPLEPHKDETKEVKTIGNLSFNTIISKLSERSRQDLVNSFLDSLTPNEQSSLLENLSTRVNKGVKVVNTKYHYLIINTTVCKYLTRQNSLQIIYRNGERYFSDKPNKLQVLFICTKQHANELKQAESNEMIEKVNCKETALDNTNIFNTVFYVSPECDVVQQQLLEKDPINEKFITGICFKLDPTGITITHTTNNRKLIQHPMSIHNIDQLGFLILEPLLNGEEKLIAKEEIRRIFARDTTEKLEFVIEVDGQERRVLYLNFM